MRASLKNVDSSVVRCLALAATCGCGLGLKVCGLGFGDRGFGLGLGGRGHGLGLDTCGLINITGCGTAQFLLDRQWLKTDEPTTKQCCRWHFTTLYKRG